MTPPKPLKLKRKPKKIPPERNIGPVYHLIGLVLLAGGMFLMYVHSVEKKGFEWIDVAFFVILVLLYILIARPEKFDSTLKTIADKLSIFSYKKD